MTAEKTERKQSGRPWPKGTSGNPAGRPKGARNKTTVMVEAMIENEAESLVRAAIFAAKDGDSSLLKAMLDRLAPVRKERTIAIELPPLNSPADAPRIAASLIEAAATGALAPGEAQALASLLESYRKQSELADVEARLAALEGASSKR